jgi:hypothetical protein
MPQLKFKIGVRSVIDYIALILGCFHSLIAFLLTLPYYDGFLATSYRHQLK